MKKIDKEEIDKYKNEITKTLYGDKYLFGSIAVKSDNGFITTLRGKENLDSFVFVKNYILTDFDFIILYLKST